MIEFNFIGGAYEARSTNLNAQKCQNFYPVVDKEGGKNVIALMGSPGLKDWADSTHAAEVRCEFPDETYLYAVIGNRVYRFTTAGVALQMTGTISTTTGAAYMAKNADDEICIVGEPDGYILDTTTNTVTIIAAAGFPNAIGLVHQDGYFIVPVQNSDSFNYSGLNDGTTWGALSYYSAESQPDYLVAIASMGRDLWVLGKKTSEIWYNSGAPFARYSNVFFETGCGAAGSVCVTPLGLVFLDNYYRIVLVPNGSYQVQPTSTYQIDYQIKQMTTKSNARAYWYQGEGHTFYVITFPSDNKTFELNLSTGFWNTRARASTDARHRGNCSAFFNGKWIIGDYENGKLYSVDYDTFTENGEVMRAIRRAQAVHQNRGRLFHHELEIEFEAGVGGADTAATFTATLTAGIVTAIAINSGGSGYVTAPTIIFYGGGGTGAVATTTVAAGAVATITIVNGGSGYTSAPTISTIGGGTDPQAMLRYSDDGGHVWSNERWMSIGQIGEYSHRVKWNRLGITRGRTYEVIVSDAVKRNIINAYLGVDDG